MIRASGARWPLASARGASSIEHVLMIACVALAALGAWSTLGGAIKDETRCAADAIAGRGGPCVVVDAAAGASGRAHDAAAAASRAALTAAADPAGDADRGDAVGVATRHAPSAFPGAHSASTGQEPSSDASVEEVAASAAALPLRGGETSPWDRAGDVASAVWDSGPVRFARGLVGGVYEGGRDLVVATSALLWSANEWLWSSGYHPLDLRPDKLSRMWDTTRGFGEGVWNAVTHPGDTWDFATSVVGALWDGVRDWASRSWDTLLHGSPEEVGHLVGRVGFEVVVTLLPVTRAGKAGEVFGLVRRGGALADDAARVVVEDAGRLAARTDEELAALADAVAAAQTQRWPLSIPETSALRRIAHEQWLDRAGLEALMRDVGELKIGRARIPPWYRWREVNNEVAYRLDALPPEVVFERGFVAPGHDEFFYTHLKGWGSSAYVSTSRDFTEGAYVVRVGHGIDVEHGVTGPLSPMSELGGAREIAVPGRIAPEDVLGRWEADPSVPSGLRFVANPSARYDVTIRGAREVGMRLHGAFDYPHELEEAIRLVRFEGAADVFATGATPGIEGFLVADGTTELVPFSLKNFGNIHDWSRVPERIEENRAIIERAGHRGVLLYASTPQLSGEELVARLGGTVEHFPREGTFSRLVFETSDGHVVVGTRGVRIVRD